MTALLTLKIINITDIDSIEITNKFMKENDFHHCNEDVDFETFINRYTDYDDINNYDFVNFAIEVSSQYPDAIFIFDSYEDEYFDFRRDVVRDSHIKSYTGVISYPFISADLYSGLETESDVKKYLINGESL